MTARDDRGAAKRQPRGKVRQRRRHRAATIGGGGEHGAEAFVEVAPLREAVDHLSRGGSILSRVRWLGVGLGPAL